MLEIKLFPLFTSHYCFVRHLTLESYAWSFQHLWCNKFSNLGIYFSMTPFLRTCDHFSGLFANSYSKFQVCSRFPGPVEIMLNKNEYYNQCSVKYTLFFSVILHKITRLDLHNKPLPSLSSTSTQSNGICLKTYLLLMTVLMTHLSPLLFIDSLTP